VTDRHANDSACNAVLVSNLTGANQLIRLITSHQHCSTN